MLTQLARHFRWGNEANFRRRTPDDVGLQKSDESSGIIPATARGQVTASLRIISEGAEKNHEKFRS
jgi:hypothetical protein